MGNELTKKKKTIIVVPWPAAVVIIFIAAMLAILTGWQGEIASRYPIYDFPRVDRNRIEQQVRSGNVSQHDAIYYRKKYAESDTSEIR